MKFVVWTLQARIFGQISGQNWPEGPYIREPKFENESTGGAYKDWPEDRPETIFFAKMDRPG